MLHSYFKIQVCSDNLVFPIHFPLLSHGTLRKNSFIPYKICPTNAQYSILNCTVLYYTILYYTILYYSALAGQTLYLTNNHARYEQSKIIHPCTSCFGLVPVSNKTSHHIMGVYLSFDMYVPHITQTMGTNQDWIIQRKLFYLTTRIISLHSSSHVTAGSSALAAVSFLQSGDMNLTDQF
jgi:hypothetical protein